MKVYKFGGASVKDAGGVRNIAEIIAAEPENLIVVISAMGKMTNAFESLCNGWFHRTGDTERVLAEIRRYHREIIDGLFGTDDRRVTEWVEHLFDKLTAILADEPSLSYDYEYDRIIPFGELLSTTIVSAYLDHTGLKNRFVDARKCLRTDENYRNANVDLDMSGRLCQQVFTFADTPRYITQGFIASTVTNQNTTLGREGSDYTAALLANILDGESVTIWKDVPGVMNGDPKLYLETVIIPRLSYHEAIELSFFGAKVIHPKTIKPLQNKNIPLYVRSFLRPGEPGTVICQWDEKLSLPPIFIDKTDQVLLTLTPRDFSFVVEEKLSRILALLAQYRLKLNLLQTSAINFTLLVDYHEAMFEKFVAELKPDYKVLYNKDVKLITIRHFDEETIRRLILHKKVLVEQRSRLTARFVVEDKNI
ncbi:aspartate kinase [Alistipes sp. OttesenSCG-928-L06]|nr:aspartate kinase [Alistipes sp. OttesenSCG-928-L06]